jgi:hypothetical protein
MSKALFNFLLLIVLNSFSVFAQESVPDSDSINDLFKEIKIRGTRVAIYPTWTRNLCLAKNKDCHYIEGLSLKVKNDQDKYWHDYTCYISGNANQYNCLILDTYYQKTLSASISVVFTWHNTFKNCKPSLNLRAAANEGGAGRCGVTNLVNVYGGAKITYDLNKQIEISKKAVYQFPRYLTQDDY